MTKTPVFYLIYYEFYYETKAAFTRQTKVGNLVLQTCWQTDYWRQVELVSICRQQFVNMFANCWCVFNTGQLEFANTSLPSLVYHVKAA